MGRRAAGGVSRARQRARASFLIVVTFFGVFGIIVLTELLLVEPREPRTTALQGLREKPDYEQFQSEDYLPLRGTLLVGGGGGGGGKGAHRGALPPAMEERLPPPPANATPPDALWQPVGGTRFKFLVYSAFYEQRGGRSVRLIGATKTRGAERVWCRLWYAANHSATVQAKVKMIRENWNLKYSACFIICPLRRNQTAPERVSVVARPRAVPANLLKVLGTQAQNPVKLKPNLPVKKSNVSATVTKLDGSTKKIDSILSPNVPISSGTPSSLVVCVKPLHFSYNRPLQLIEFIELNALLGATHFVMYNHTVGKQVACVLQHYVKSGMLTLLPWQLNMLSQKEIRTEGLFAALNDCLYRSMYRYTYAALIDLDEYIVPRRARSLTDLLSSLETRSDSRSAGAFSFQNAFFYLQWPDEAIPEGEETIPDTRLAAALVTQRKTRRRQKLHPHKQRSKYVCRPERVLEAGNHFVWEFVAGSAALSVPPDHAILHHYRVCEFGGDDCVKTPSFVDRTALKYRAELLERVGAQYVRLKQACQLPNLPQPTPQPKPK